MILRTQGQETSRHSLCFRNNLLLVCKILLPVIIFSFCLFYRVNFVFFCIPLIHEFNVPIHRTKGAVPTQWTKFIRYHLVNFLSSNN